MNFAVVLLQDKEIVVITNTMEPYEITSIAFDNAWL